MRFIFKLIFVFLGLSQRYETYNSRYAKFIGVKFGRNFRLTGLIHFSSEPYLIEIGDDVTLTPNVKFLTHDGGVGVFRKEYPGINIIKKIILGNNVFVGANSIILAGVNIGNNVVIGAGSVVTKNIPDDSVAVGNPARVIRTISEYKEKALTEACFILENDQKKRRTEILTKISAQSQSKNSS